MVKTTFIFILSISTLYAQSTKDTMRIEHYYAQGLPNLKRTWVPEDYEKAVKVLEDMAKKDIRTLPRKKSPNTQAIFEKLASLHSYEFLSDSIFDMETKATYIFSIQPCISKFFRLYPTDIINDRYEYAKEAINFFPTMIYFTEEMLKLGDYVVKSNPNLTKVQKEGLEKMRYGLNTLVASGLLTLEKEFVLFEKEDIVDFANYFFNFYKKSKKYLDKDAMKEHDTRILALAKAHKYKELRRIIEKSIR